MRRKIDDKILFYAIEILPVAFLRSLFMTKSLSLHSLCCLRKPQRRFNEENDEKNAERKMNAIFLSSETFN